jgi:hypothetical protein
LSSNAKYQARGGAQDGFGELREITARGHHERQPLGLGMLSSYLDDLRLDIGVVDFLAAWLSSFTGFGFGQLRSHGCGYLCGLDLIPGTGAGEVRVLRK